MADHHPDCHLHSYSHRYHTGHDELYELKLIELSQVVQVRAEGPKAQKQHALKGQKLLALGGH